MTAPEGDPSPSPPPVGRVVFLGVLLCIPPFFIAAALVLPQYRDMQLRSHRVEAPEHLAAIRRGVLEAAESSSSALSLPRCPPELPLGAATSWTPACLEAYSVVGFHPQGGATWCSYVVDASTGKDGALGFRAVAKCDLDGDRHPAVFEATREAPPRMLSDPRMF